MPVNRFDVRTLLDDLHAQSTILVPNHRIQDALRDSFSNECAHSAWLTPPVFAIDIWLRELWDTAASHGIAPCTDIQILEGNEELLLWGSIIEKSMPEIPLINPDETAAEVQRSYQLLRLWLLDNGSDEQLARFTGQPDIAFFLHWKNQYQSICRKKGLASLVDCTRALIDNADRLATLLPSNLVLVNFFSPPPLYQQLFQQLKRLSKLRSVNTAAINANPTRVKYHFDDAQSEFEAAAEWAQRLADNDPAAHVGIIFNGNNLARRRLERVFVDRFQVDALPLLADTSRCFNSTSNLESLQDYPLVYDALLLLGLNNEKQDSNNLCRILQSPHIACYEEELEARLQMELFMRRNYSATATVSEFIRHLSQSGKPYCCPQLANSLLAFRTRFRATRGYANSDVWAKLFADQLNISGWPGNKPDLSDVEHKVQRQWESVLAQFARCNVILEKMNFTTALSRLRILCAQSRLKPGFIPTNPRSLYTLSEAVGLHFDHIWMLGFDDRSWPPASDPSSFLPYALQRDAGIPGSRSDLQLHHARQALEQLWTSVRESIVASFHASEDDQQLRPSLAIKAFPLHNTLPGSLPPRVTEDSDFPAPVLASFLDCAMFPLQETEKPRGGHSIISNQSSCPFRAFVKHRLHAEPINEFASGLSSVARGNAIHLALERLYKNIDGKQSLQALPEQERSRLVTESTAVAIDSLCQKFRLVMTPRFQAIESQRIAGLLKTFLALELERGDFRVSGLEHKAAWQRGALTLNLKIDRIDTLDDGGLMLIDYKTGKTTPSLSRLLEARPEDMQLPVYLTAIAPQPQTPVNGVSIAHINIEKSGYTAICAGDNFHKSAQVVDQDQNPGASWEQTRESLRRKVEFIADEFCAGIAKVAPVNDEKTCAYCELQALCRVTELRAPGDSFDEQEEFE